MRAGACAGCKVVMIPDMTPSDYEAEELCTLISSDFIQLEEWIIK